MRTFSHQVITVNVRIALNQLELEVKKRAKRLQNAEKRAQFFSVLLEFVTYQLVRAGKRAHVKSQFVRLGIRKKGQTAYCL